MNNIQKIENTTLTMSSREIAELCAKEHRNVIRDINNMFQQLEIDSEGYAQNCAHPQNGQIYREFLLPKDLTLTLIAGYNIKLRKRIIDRWQELEEKQATLNPANLSRMQLIQIAMEAEQERQELENKVQEQKPKVDGFDRIATSDGGLNMTNAAKSLNVRPKDLFDFLQENKWIYRRVGRKSFVAYQEKIQAGYLTHKVHIARLDDGTERVNEQVIVTPKGLTKLSICMQKIAA